MSDGEDLSSQRYYKRLIELMPDAILIVGGETILFVNPASLSLLAAASPDAIVGRSIYDFLVPIQHATVRHRFHALQTASLPLEARDIRMIRFDGTLREVELVGYATEYEGIAAIQLIVRDVTEQRKTQEEHDRFFAMSLDLLGVYDFNGMPVVVNPAWEKLFGYSMSEHEDKPFGARLHPDDKPAAYAAYSMLIEGQAITNVELRHMAKDGNYRLIRWNASSLPEHKKIYAVGHDITEIRTQQELLQKTEKLSIVGQLAAGLAHEIRNPLTSLKGFLQLFRNKFGHDVKYEEYFRIMDGEFNRIEDIVSEFLILAKPQPRSFKPCSMEVLVPDVVKLLEPQALLNNVEMQVALEDALPPVHGDENQLKQVFVNVIKNSIEAMPQGGVLTATVLRSGTDRVLVRIADQGQGIPPEKLSQLGVPFLTTKENGTGLGLMICYKIVEAHHGEMRIDSEWNKGTTVEVLLPCKENDSNGITKG